MTIAPEIEQALLDAAHRASRDERDPRTSSSMRRRPVRRRLGMLAVTLGLGATSIAGARLALIESDPVPVPPRSELPQERLPRPGTAELATVRVPDPAGGPDWALRVSRSREGGRCYAAGRVVGSRIGVVADGRFHPLPSFGYDQCVTLSAARPLSLGVRFEADPARGGPRTIVQGLATARVAAVEITKADGMHRTVPDDQGALLAVYAGNPDLELTVVYTDGRRQIL